MEKLTSTGGILCCGTVEVLAEQMIWELENLELFGASPDGHVERRAKITVQVISAMGNIPRIKAEPDPDVKIDWTLYATVDDVPLRVVPEVSESVNNRDPNEYVKLMAMVPKWPGTLLEFLMATCRASMAGLIRNFKQWMEQTELHDYWEASGMTKTIKTLWQMIEALRDERNEERRPSMAMAAANFADGGLLAEQLVDARRNPDASPSVPFTKTAFDVLDRWHKSLFSGRTLIFVDEEEVLSPSGGAPAMHVSSRQVTYIRSTYGETCRICQENYFEIIPAYLAQPGSIGRREVVYYCKECADLADDLDPLIAGVQQDVVTLARLPAVPPNEQTRLMLADAVPPRRMRCIGDISLSIADDPVVQDARRRNWSASIASNEAWQQAKDEHIARTGGFAERDKYRQEVKAEKRAELTLTLEEKEEKFAMNANFDRIAQTVLGQQENWLERWGAGLPEWKALVDEFEDEADMRDWEMKQGSDPEVKKRVELAFIWMTAKNEIASSIMPIRIHEYFEKGMNERKANKAHVKRVNSIIEKLSRLGL